MSRNAMERCHIYWLIVLACCVRCAVQSSFGNADETCCTPADKELVQRQWNAVWRHDSESSKQQILFAKTILIQVIADYPEILPLFAGVGITRPRGGAFSAHCMRIANAFDMIINMLNNEESLNEALNHLARQHVARPGIRAEHMKAFAEVLHDTLLQLLDEYDAMAWKSCWKLIANGLMQGLPP